MFTYEVAYSIVSNFCMDIFIILGIVIVPLLIVLMDFCLDRLFHDKNRVAWYIFRYFVLLSLLTIGIFQRLSPVSDLSKHYKDFSMLCKSRGLTVPEVIYKFLFYLTE